jgi:response regulator RpfG family c-di-GMP phosphodiesterase
MPELNGYDTAQYIRQELHSNIPIIAMTAHVLPGEKEKCISFGMTDYISKPIREPELYNLIQMYTSQTDNTKKMAPVNPDEEAADRGPVTNLDYLRMLSNGKPWFVEEMKELFLSENPQEIKQLENAILKKDYETMGHVAHKIKSTIPFVGLSGRIENNLSEMEKLAESHADWNVIDQHFRKVKSVCLKAIEELKSSDTHHV